jgi:hypothetical protein
MLMAIARWGARFMGERREDDWLSPSAYFLRHESSLQPCQGMFRIHLPPPVVASPNSTSS